MTEELFCPECDEPLTEKELRKSLFCPHCKTNLKKNRYRDFLEFLIAQDIIDNVDFFDMSIYGEEVIKNEPVVEPDETDPSDYEKKYIDTWDEFEEEREAEEESRAQGNDEKEWDPLDTDEIEDLTEKEKEKKKNTDKSNGK